MRSDFHRWATVLAVALGVGAVGAWAWTQPQKPGSGGAAVKPEGIRAKQPEEAHPDEHAPDNPGEPHAALAKLAGTWNTSSIFSYGGEAQPATTGLATLKSVLGGRFLAEDNSGEMMGEPVSGFRFVGYNNATKEYEAAWAYTGSTALLTLKGTSADHGKTINLRGSYRDVNAGDHTLQVTMKTLDPDRFQLTMKGGGEPEEQTAVLEISYTRAK